MTTSRAHRIIAVLLIKLLLLDVCYPTVALALTGGPSQPEFESFEPVSTDDMVDLFTGDFKYNIPLMTVPGPNGGYPINLAYQSGIGMEDEASWVGLGWNINAGEVTRQMRGLPDEFSGDQVRKRWNMKPNWTASIRYSPKRIENFGGNFILQPSFDLYYNCYRGAGFKTAVSLVPGEKTDKGTIQEVDGLHINQQLSFDSNGGLEYAPSLAFLSKGDHTAWRANLAFSFSSRYGLSNIDLQGSRQWNQVRIPKTRNANLRGTAGSGFSFCTPSHVPGHFAPYRGFDVGLGVTFGEYIPLPTFKEHFGLLGSASSEHIAEAYKDHHYPAYGFMRAEECTDEEGLLDFNRDKDVPVTRRIPTLPLPVATHDTYLVKGQGVGGAFRAFRSDVGIFHDETRHSTTTGGNLSAELAVTAPPIHVGVNPAFSHSSSHSGPWRSGLDALAPLVFQGETPSSDPLYEPFYLRMAGDMTASPVDEYDYLEGNAPVRFELGVESSLHRMAAKAKNQLNCSNCVFDMSKNRRSARQKRDTHIEYRTMKELREYYALVGSSSRPKVIQTMNELPAPWGSSTGSAYSYPTDRDTHLGEIRVRSGDGTLHTYGLPAYVASHKEATYAIPSGMVDWGAFPATVHEGSNTGWYDALPGNVNGEDHFYSSTELPPYVHTHLLTGVFSTDYVDVDNNGPSDNDLGYCTKFNYTKAGLSAYRWRFPYRGGKYIKGFYSNTEDDKANYSYGTKEIYYLHSIETKTHIALFVLNENDERSDARGAADEANTTSAYGAHSKRLDRIELYSKQDIAAGPVQTILFDYCLDSDPQLLCRGAVNNEVTDGGKLTLKSVTFRYRDSSKGQLNPYVFNYIDPDLPVDQNPAYNLDRMDRWGNYMVTTTDYSVENPYTPQTEYDPQTTDGAEAIAERNARASAWHLRSIQLPSGGVLKVNYESDDYGYVQDKPATQMFKIAGTGTIGGSVPGEDDDWDIKKNDLRIYVETEGISPENEQAFTDACVGMKDVYFKVYTRLKNRPGFSEGFAFDYVEGYGKIVDAGVVPYTNGTKAYVDLEAALYGGLQYDVHPFRKAAWQYLRYERTDLLNPPNNFGDNTLAGILSPLSASLSALQMLAGFYGYANLMGWCNRIAHARPSYLRLPSPDQIKYGGGCRVKRIEVTDAWGEGERSYGKEYTYRITDHGRDISSGVAAYEPMIGSEECALHKPVWYNDSDSRISMKNPSAFVEEPFGEAYYPAPLVGYRRVVVTDLLDDPDVTKGQDGIEVHEFYTAKDFPVDVQRTGMDDTHFAPPPLFVPFVGVASFNNNGYSMGYAITLNDMHGRPRSSATYPYGADLAQDQPRTKVTYEYQTDPTQPSKLDNKVTVLVDHYTKENAIMGKTTEFFIDESEHSTFSESYGLNFNVEFAPLSWVWVMLEPHIDLSQSIYRHLVTNKVMNCSGILKRITTEVDGARSVAENILFDADNGQPLLTSVNNSWEDPVFTYKYAAHMAYDGMAPAYRNWRMTLSNASISGGELAITNAAHYFAIGDELAVYNAMQTTQLARLWVSDFDGPDHVVLQTASGGTPSDATGAYIRVAASGYKNMQGITNGSIVTLRDPITQYTTPSWSMFDVYNDEITGTDNSAMSDLGICGMEDYGIGIGVSISSNNGIYNIDFIQGMTTCKGNVHFPEGVVVSDLGDVHFLGFSGEPYECDQGQTCRDILVELLSTQETYVCQWDPGVEMECFPTCIKVLHADATAYRSDWDPDYTDAGLSAPSANVYLSGKANVWRPDKTYLYQVDRLEPEASITNIRVNGEYRGFQFFKFGDPGSNDWRWIQRDETTRFSPFGGGLEAKDANDNYTSQLMGYNNCQVTATAANASYYEQAFDGFEDHGTYAPGHGHVVLGNTTLSTAQAHTGGKSAIIPIGQSLALNGYVEDATPSGWSPKAGKGAVISAWFYAGANGGTPTIKVYNNGSLLTPASTMVSDAPIEGWRKLDVETPQLASGSVTVQFSMPGAAGPTYLDDLRMHPAQAVQNSFVFEPKQFRLVAQLDERNYATFYNYDEEGVLVQVKKETERGVQTITTNRQNAKY